MPLSEAVETLAALEADSDTPAPIKAALRSQRVVLHERTEALAAAAHVVQEVHDAARQASRWAADDAAWAMTDDLPGLIDDAPTAKALASGEATLG